MLPVFEGCCIARPKKNFIPFGITQYNSAGLFIAPNYVSQSQSSLFMQNPQSYKREPTSHPMNSLTLNKLNRKRCFLFIISSYLFTSSCKNTSDRQNSFIINRRLCRSQSRNRHAERRAGYVVKPNLMAELY